MARIAGDCDSRDMAARRRSGEEATSQTGPYTSSARLAARVAPSFVTGR
jgi:hypothetical protein